MPDTTTTNLSLTKPGVGDAGGINAWGGKLNTNFDTLDALFKGDGTGTSHGANIGSGKTLTLGGTLSAVASSVADLLLAAVSVAASRFSIKDATDSTKVVKFDVSGVTTGTTRTLTVPNASITLAAVPTAYTSVQRFTSGSGTYTTPSGVKFLRVRMVAGGGGGAGTDGSNRYFGTSGGTTSFGSWTAAGGGYPAGGSGGSNGTGTLLQRIRGNYGATFMGGTSIIGSQPGGGGPWGGSGGGGYTSAGVSAVANSGAGGGGGAAAGFCEVGGGAGEYVEFIVESPASSYSYAVGAGGNGASATYGGGNGGSGVIIVEEYYS